MRALYSPSHAAVWAYLLLLCSGTLLLNGCGSLRNEVDPSLLGVSSAKLVVSGFISPQDTILAIKVTRSNTVVGDSISLLQTGNNVTNATVTLSEGSKTVNLPYNNLSYGDTVTIRPYYSIQAQNLPIVAGHTYTLTVTTPYGERATSSCTIPAPVSLSAISALDVVNQRYFVRAQWQDPIGQANYYQLSGIFVFINASCKSCQTTSYNTLSFDDDNRGLSSDAGLDGTAIQSGRLYLTSSSAKDFLSQYKTASVIVNLMSIDQAYYQFQEAVIRQRRSRNNPFAEPVLIPSNIQGGLGCFAGYNNAPLTKVLK